MGENAEDASGSEQVGGDEPERRRLTRSQHARLRASSGRPTGQAANDIQRAGPNDVFVQAVDQRFVVRGPAGREHIIERDGELVTSLHRPHAAHIRKVQNGDRRPATAEETSTLKSFVN